MHTLDDKVKTWGLEDNGICNREAAPGVSLSDSLELITVHVLNTHPFCCHTTCSQTSAACQVYNVLYYSIQRQSRSFLEVDRVAKLGI